MSIGIGIVGYGYWGPNLVRNFAEAPEAKVVAVCDLEADRLGTVKMRYPAIETTSDYAALLEDDRIEAIVVATPVSTHFQLAREALSAGKHVLAEKPLTARSVEALELIEEAADRNRVLMVDHTFVYTGAVRKMKELMEGKMVGEVLYYDSVRINLGLFQHDVDVVWDLAVHDLSIMDYLLEENPVAVSATGMNHLEGQPDNVAYLTLYFDGKLIAHIHVNWLAPVKIRRTLVGGSLKMIVFDDLEPSEKVKVYDKGVTFTENPEKVREMLVGYRAGDMWAPQLDRTEALQREARHFLDCIRGKERPMTDGRAGLRVVRILEAANQSMKNRGAPVALDLPS